MPESHLPSGDLSGSNDFPMDYRSIVHGTARGVLYATIGQTLLLLVGLLGGVFLARLLTPQDFGIYAVISFVVLKLNALAELGLNAKLIHDNESPCLAYQRSVFTLHCLIALTVYAIVYLLAPWFVRLFQLGDVTFCRTVGLIILIQPFCTIPIALLSRQLRYDSLTLAELVDGIIYQAIAVTLAFLNFSYWSFGIAALLSTVGRSLFLNVSFPWCIGLALDTAYLRRCARFGGTFQLSSLTAVARDNIVTFLGAPLFGPAAVGLLNWSLRLAWICSQTYVAICARIAFPSLSLMRSDPRLFGSVLTKMLRYLNLATLLTLSVVTALAPEIVHLVYTDKWLPAIPLFYYFALRMVAGNYTTLLDLGIKAQGHPERSLRILSLWTVWEWAFALVSVAMFGYVGIAISAAVGIWFALICLYREVSRVASINLWRVSATPSLCGGVTFLSLYWGKGERIDSLPLLGLAMIAGALIYVFMGILVEGRRFWADIKADLAILLSGRKTPVPSAIGTAD